MCTLSSSGVGVISPKSDFFQGGVKKVPIFINKSTDTLTVQGEGWHPILLVRGEGSGHPVLYMCTCMVPNCPILSQTEKLV